MANAVEASMLIAGDGIDLVVLSPSRKRLTLQLTIAEAYDLAARIVTAAKQSEDWKPGPHDVVSDTWTILHA